MDRGKKEQFRKGLFLYVNWQSYTSLVCLESPPVVNIHQNLLADSRTRNKTIVRPPWVTVISCQSDRDRRQNKQIPTPWAGWRTSIPSRVPGTRAISPAARERKKNWTQLKYIRIDFFTIDSGHNKRLNEIFNRKSKKLHAENARFSFYCI